MTQRRPLTPKEIKFVEAKVAGKSNTEAAMIATGAKTKDVAKTQGHRLSTNVNVQEELAKAFVRHGITIDAATKPIADGLKATKTVIVRDKGAPADSENSAFADEVPDHTVRLNASKQAFALMGMGKQDAGGNTINNFIVMSSDKKDEYGF